MRTLWRRLMAWLAVRRRRGHWKLRGDLIVHGAGSAQSDFLRVADIESWIDYNDMWIYKVTVRLQDGRVFDCTDRHAELERILYRVAPERCQLVEPHQVA